MSKQFVKGNVYVFTRKNFIKSMGAKGHKSVLGKEGWVNHCNGNVVTIEDNYYGNMGNDGSDVVSDWCKCIKNNNPKIESEEI